MSVPNTFADQGGQIVPAAELDENFAFLDDADAALDARLDTAESDITTLEGEVAALVAGSGAVRYLFNSTGPTYNDLAHGSLTLGASYQYLYASPLDQDGAGGMVRYVDATGTGLVDGAWLYDATLHRSYILGAGVDGSKPRLFKVRSAKEDLRSWDLNCVSGTGGDAIIAAAVNDIIHSYYADTTYTSLGALLTGVGVHTPANTIDLKNCPVDARELTIVGPNTFTSILPILRSGTPSSGALNNKLDNPRRVNVTVKGHGTSNFSTISNEIGLQLYDWASPVGTIESNFARLWRGLDFGGNSEKLEADCGFGYCWQCIGYSPVQVSATYGGSTPVTYDMWPYLANRGSWNPTTNTPALVSGVGTKGWFYKASASGSVSPALDGITSVNNGDIILFTGSVYSKRSSINFSPDTNKVTARGENNVMGLWMPDAADCSIIATFCMEGRIDPGPAYDITNFQGAVIPIPFFYDGNGKETVITPGSWLRAGDSRLIDYINKDNGVDSARRGYSVDHMYGTVGRYDRVLNLDLTGMYLKDIQNGRYLGNSTPIPCPVLQYGSIGTITGRPAIVQSLNREGILGGSVSLGLLFQNNRAEATVKMGQAVSTTDISSGRGYVALRGEYMDNVQFDLTNSVGQIVLDDVCADGTTPSSIHRTTVIVDPAWCATAAISNAAPAFKQGAQVDAAMVVRGGMSMSDARSTVAQFSGATDVLFEDIYGRGAVRYDGSRFAPA